MIKKITDIFKRKKKNKEPVFSFEVFPPRTSSGMKKLFSVIEELAELEPDYISVTYGAGGSTSKNTLDIIRKIQMRFGISCMHHFTLVNQTTEALKTVSRDVAGDPYDSAGNQRRALEKIRSMINAGSDF